MPLTQMLWDAHSMARVCVILQTPALEAPYEVEGARFFSTICVSDEMRKGGFVREIRCHSGREGNGTLDSKPNKGSRSHSCCVK